MPPRIVEMSNDVPYVNVAKKTPSNWMPDPVMIPAKSSISSVANGNIVGVNALRMYHAFVSCPSWFF